MRPVKSGNPIPVWTPSLVPYTAALYDYVRNELKFESDLPYEIMNGKVWPWSYADHENRYVNVAETLRHAMCVNPHLKVHVANGLLRPGHTLLRHPIHLQPARPGEGIAGTYHHELLRSRAHDVRSCSIHKTAEREPGQVYPERDLIIPTKDQAQL